MFTTQKTYSLSFVISVILHLLLFAFLFTSFVFNSKLPYVVKKGHAKKIVEATAINQQQVQEEVTRLKQRQAQKKQAQENYIRKLERLAKDAKSERTHELNRLAQLKVHQRQLKKQQTEEQQQAQKRLDQLKQQQILQQQRLTQLEKRQQSAATNFKAQQQKLAALKKQQLTLNKKKQQSEDAKALLKQQLQQEQQQLAKARAAYIQGIVNKYNALVLQAIYRNWFVPPNANPKLHVKLQVAVSKTGAVSAVTILQSSGNKALDQSASLAVYKASPLPIPTNNPVVFRQFKLFSITMSPNETLAAG